jgi:CheY-like chemotaxis protein
MAVAMLLLWPAHARPLAATEARSSATQVTVVMNDTVTDALAAEGFKVHGLPDGLAALELPQAGPFDLVILDLMLPGLSRTEVCRRLRADSPVPINMLTRATRRRIVFSASRSAPTTTSPSRSRRWSCSAACARSYAGESVTLSPSEYTLLAFSQRSRDES